MGKMLWFGGLAIGLIGSVSLGLYFGGRSNVEAEQGQSVLEDMWVLHPFEQMTKERVRINDTCYNLFREKTGWAFEAELCPVKDIYKGQSRVEILNDNKVKKLAQHIRTNLFWVKAENLEVFRKDLIDYPRLYSVKENGTCYNYESNGPANGTFDFLAIDCTLFLPSLCAGLHQINCTSATYI